MITSPSGPGSDDVTAHLRAALAETADGRPVGAPPTFSWETEAGSVPTSIRARRRRAVRVAWVAAPLAVAAAVAAAVVLPPAQPSARLPHSVIAAPGAGVTTSPGIVPAALLTPGSSVPMKAGQYRYQRVTTTIMTSETEGFTDVFETWEPQDPTQEWTMRTTTTDLQGDSMGGPEVQTARCGAFRPPDRNWPDDQATYTARVCAELDSPMRYSSAYIVELPTDPQALYDRLRTDTLDVVLPTMHITPEGHESFYIFQSAQQIATGATGLSQPVSAALEKAVAMVPGVTVRHDVTNPKGVGGTTYYPPPTPGVDLGAMTFDADGNYIGDPDTTIEVGAADAPLAVPTDVTD